MTENGHKELQLSLTDSAGIV